MARREVDIVVISDVHLGTYGCQAKELLRYLKSVKPKLLILNGDIIDMWQFSKNYWPETHTKVIRRILKYVTEDTPVYYLTGNHDELLRKFTDFDLGSFKLQNKLVLTLPDGKRAWFFHGDVFDVTMQHSKWLAKLGAVGYDTLIVLNYCYNWVLEKIGREKYSFSQKIKHSVKSAVKFMNDFENTAADLAIEKKYDYVVCGHIHHPEMRQISNEKGAVTYLNSGDWVESLTALEYNKGAWEIYTYKPEDYADVDETSEAAQFDNENLDEKTDVTSLLKTFVESKQ